MSSSPLAPTPDDAAPEEGELSLQRVTVVVDLHEPVGADVAGRVAAHLPLAELPAVDDATAREDDVRASSDGRSLEVVLLLAADTPEEAEAMAVSATERALRSAGLDHHAARASQVVVQGAYLP